MVGFCFGAMERTSLLPKLTAMQAGNVLIGLPSSGLHSNGFALARSVIRMAGFQYEQAAPFDPTRSLGEALLTPSRIYTKSVLALSNQSLLLGAAHICAGGLTGCLSSVIPQSLNAHLTADAWELPTVLRWLAAVGKIKCRELASTFNCGIGMVLVVSEANQERVMQLLREHQEEPIIVGELVERQLGKDAVEVQGAEGSWLMLPELGVSLPFPEVLSSLQAPRSGARTRTVVVGGRQDISCVRALLQLMSSPACASELVAMASIHTSSKMLKHSAAAGLTTCVIGDGRLACYDDSEGGVCEVEDVGAAATEFSEALQHLMQETHAHQLLLLSDAATCLLTGEFLESLLGQVLLVHDSLLPAFPEARPLDAALAAGACITGCTVCFAMPTWSSQPGVRHGPIIMQEATRVLPGDTITTLHNRVVTECECKTLPQAMQLVAEGSVLLNRKGKIERTASWVKDLNDNEEKHDTIVDSLSAFNL
jgi:folate-dependent phosphoribosylglycinamide formyltransferase PurN